MNRAEFEKLSLDRQRIGFIVLIGGIWMNMVLKYAKKSMFY